MARIEESLGLAGVQAPEDLVIEKRVVSPVALEHNEEVAVKV
jgi:hypothetical protein